MSDVAAVPGEAAVTAGQLLRHARESAGLHVATLAANLKVPVRKLEALEEDRYDLLPDAVFVRALASSVCRTLKMDPQPVLERLPQTSRPRLVQDNDGINTPFRAPGDAPRSGWGGQLSRPVAFIVIALLLGAVVLIFLPVAQRRDGAAIPARTEPVMPPGTPTVISPPVENAPAATATATPALVAPRAQAASATASAAVAAAPAAAAPASAAAAAAAPASSASAALAAGAPAQGIVTFRTRGTSWIQVTDAHGTPVLRKLMEAGETAGASGALPLAVTIGSVEQTEVQVRGKPFNLQPVARDNVARFEVK